MGKSSITQSVTELIEPILRESRLELVDLEFKKSGKSWILRVFIDKDQGVTVNDCQSVSRQIEDLIEVEDIISSPYVLEVSSPGLDRPLKKERDFLKFKGKRIQVRTFSPIEKNRQFIGTIEGFRNQTLYLDCGKGVMEIPLSQIANAKLIIEI